MAGKRTNKASGKKTKAGSKPGTRQKAFLDRAKKVIQPAAEKSVTGEASILDYLAAQGENGRQALEDAYGKRLCDYINGHYKHPAEYEKLIPQLLKNHDIRITGLLTKIARQDLDVRVYQLKICTKNTSKIKRCALESKFIEAKWCHNDVLRQGAFDYDPKPKQVSVHNKSTGEDVVREYRFLTQQERQAICSQVKEDISSLSKKKAKGGKVGRLRFVRSTKSIPLKQKGKTFDIAEDTSSVFVAGVGWIPARGLDQVRGKDIANAVLVRHGCDYYLHVTVYQERKRNAKYHQPGTVVGCDFGVGPAMTCSDSTMFALQFAYTETYRKLSRKLSRQERGSRGWWETLAQIEHEMQKTVFARDDAANKAFAYLSMNEVIITQDDPLPAWINKKSAAHGNKKVPLGILGRLKEMLKDADRAVVLERFEATTKTCPFCGKKHDVDLSQQGLVICPHCGKERYRNTGAAWTMETIAKEKHAAGLPAGFVPLSPTDRHDGDLRACERTAWTYHGVLVDTPTCLDGQLGHVENAGRDKAGCPVDGGRKKKRKPAHWTSKKRLRGKEDAWQGRSRNYGDYVSEQPEVFAPFRGTPKKERSQEERRAHNSSRHKAHPEKAMRRRRMIDRSAVRMVWDLHAGGYISEAERDEMLECARSGKPFKSCVPQGLGELTPVEMVSDSEK